MNYQLPLLAKLHKKRYHAELNNLDSLSVSLLRCIFRFACMTWGPRSGHHSLPPGACASGADGALAHDSIPGRPQTLHEAELAEAELCHPLEFNRSALPEWEFELGSPPHVPGDVGDEENLLTAMPLKGEYASREELLKGLQEEARKEGWAVTVKGEGQDKKASRLWLLCH